MLYFTSVKGMVMKNCKEICTNFLKFSMISFVIIFEILFVTACSKLKIDEKDYTAQMNNSIRPSGSKLEDIIMPSSSDETEIKQFVINLHKLAYLNLKNDSKVAWKVTNETEVLGMDTGGVRYFVKNGNEYFNTDYFYVPDGGVNGIVKAAAAETTNYAYRLYYNLDLCRGFDQKAKELNYEKIEDTVKFGVNWNKLYFENSEKSLEIPKYFSESLDESEFYCSFVWDLDTIKEASVEYNSIEGYYEIEVKLDCTKEKTLGTSLLELVSGTGDSNAKYTEVTETIQIWDNGRFKEFFSYDEWFSPKAYGIISNVKSANDYKTYFYYDDYSTTISNYQYASEYIEKSISA